jgi:MFS family permease
VDSRGGAVARPRPDVPSGRRDVVATASGATIYSVALGVASVALPLLALEAGYSGVQVGVLVALSAVSQMLSRIGMGGWLNRLPDWTFVFSAGLMLALSSGLAALTTAVVPFAIAHLLQGVSRAFFWTGSQTHAVRGPRPPVRGMAVVNLSSSVGLLTGPVLAGLLGERSLVLAMAVGAGLAVVGLVPALLLHRYPPFSPPKGSSQKRIWRRPGVDAGCWAGVSAGAWRGLLGSYVPVGLNQAGQSTGLIGVLVAIANAAQMSGSAGVTRLGRRGLARSLVVGAVLAGAGTAAVGFLAGHAVLAGVALAVSGVGAGLLQTAGPAVAVEAVHPEERGTVMATSGTFRAAALLASPLVAAGIVAVAPVSVALAVGGVLIAVPARWAWRLSRRPSAA